MNTGHLLTFMTEIKVPDTCKTILVVEDNQELRDSLVDILTLEGYIVHAAENGLYALALLELITPALILSDISMPEMDGVDLYRTVKAHDLWANIPFIFLTAYNIKSELSSTHELRDEKFFVKPVDAEELFAAIRSRLEPCPG